MIDLFMDSPLAARFRLCAAGSQQLSVTVNQAFFCLYAFYRSLFNLSVGPFQFSDERTIVQHAGSAKPTSSRRPDGTLVL
jgi:hypothetical protein